MFRMTYSTTILLSNEINTAKTSLEYNPNISENRPKSQFHQRLKSKRLGLLELNNYLTRTDTIDSFDECIKILNTHNQKIDDLPFSVKLRLLEIAIHYRCRVQIEMVLEAIKQSQRLEPNQLLRILKLHSKARDMIGLISTFQFFRAPIFDIPLIHDCIISSWAVNSDMKRGLLQFESILNIDIHPSEKIMLNVVDALIKHENFDDAQKCVEKLGSLQAHIRFLVSWINLKSSQKNQNVVLVAEKILELSSSLPKDGLEAIYISLFDLARRRSSAALAVKITKRLESLNLEASLNLKSAQAAAFLASGMLKQAESKIGTILLGEPLQLWTNISGSISRIIGASLKTNNLKLAKSLYLILKERGLKPSPHIAHQFLVYYIRKGNREIGLEFYNEMINDGLIPTSRVFEVVLELCIGDDEKMAYYWSELEKISKNNPSNVSSKEQELDTPFYTPTHAQKMVQHLLRSNRHMDDTKFNLDIKYAPGRRSYLALAQMMKTMGTVDDVEMVLNKMEAEGYTWCVRAYNILLSTYRSRQTLNKMDKLVERMIASNYKLSIPHFRIIILAHAEAQQYQRACDWLVTMKSVGYGISSTERNLLYVMRRSGIEDQESKKMIENATKIQMNELSGCEDKVEAMLDNITKAIKP